MSHESEAILRKSISDEKKKMRRNTGDKLEVLVNNIEKILVLTSKRVKN